MTRQREEFRTEVIAASRDDALRVGDAQAEAWFGAPMMRTDVTVTPQGGTLGHPNDVTHYVVGIGYVAFADRGE